MDSLFARSDRDGSAPRPPRPHSASGEHLEDAADADISVNPAQWEGVGSNTPSHNHHPTIESPKSTDVAKAVCRGGEDWLSVAFYVEFSSFEELALRLDTAQTAAKEMEREPGCQVCVNAPDEVRFGETAFVVDPGGRRLGGAKGLGMRWSLHSQHRLTVLIANMAKPKSACPNLNIQCTSEPLMRLGFRKVWELMQSYIEAMGGTLVDARNRLSRVDACVDLAGIDVKELCLPCKSGWFVTRAKYGPNFYCEGLRDTGFVVGKAPQLLRVYDKLGESRRDPFKRSLLIERRWGVLPDAATRVEMQLGRTTLKRYGVDTVEDWIEKRGAVVENVLSNWFRILSGPVDRNHTERASIHPHWETVQSAFTSCYGEAGDIELKPLPKQEVDTSKQVKQVIGLFVGMFARIGSIITSNEKFFRESSRAIREVAGNRELRAEVRRKMILLGVPIPPEIDEGPVPALTAPAMEKSDSAKSEKLRADTPPDRKRQPWDPPEVPRLCRCVLCEDVYQSSEMKYDSESDRFRCRNWPECKGESYGYHVWAHRDNWGEEE